MATFKGNNLAHVAEKSILRVAPNFQRIYLIRKKNQALSAIENDGQTQHLYPISLR